MTDKQKAINKLEELKDFFDTMGKVYFSNEIRDSIKLLKNE